MMSMSIIKSQLWPLHTSQEVKKKSVTIPDLYILNLANLLKSLFKTSMNISKFKKNLLNIPTINIISAENLEDDYILLIMMKITPGDSIGAFPKITFTAISDKICLKR